MDNIPRRSCDIDALATIIFHEFTNRYTTYNELDDEFKKLWEKVHKDHSIVSEAGYGPVLTTIKNLNKERKLLGKDGEGLLNFIDGKIDHRCTADYFSEEARNILKTSTWSKGKLRYEHIVPKKKFLYELKEKAKNGTLTFVDVRNKLDKYYYVATITVEEDKLLSGKLRNDMPEGWDDTNIFARYEKVGIELIPNPIYSRNNH